MAAEYFNSLGGFSAGLPEVPVIDANGNIITNVLTNGNVFANVVYASYYRWANGQPFTGGGNSTPGGSNTQLQFNNNGTFAGIPNVTWNGSNLSLGNVANIKITGGTSGYYLQTDGSGNLQWAPGSGNGGGGTPGGLDTYVQYNNAGNFGGSSSFTFNSTNNLLTVANLTVTGTLTASIPGSSITGAVPYATTANSVAGANVSGAVTYATTANSVAGANVSGQVSYAAVANSVAGGNVTGAVGLATYATTSNSVAGANVSGQVNYAAVANSVAGGNVTGAVGLATYATTANSVAGANVSGYVANANHANVADSANSVAGANVSGAVAYATTANSVAGANVSGSVSGLDANISNVKISGGTNGYVLQTDGSGNLSWTAQTGGGGNGTVAGANTQVQFNDAGNFGGNSGFTFDKVSGVLTAIHLNGEGGNISNIQGGNISGAVSSATSATTAGTVTTAAQPNITSVGTLTSLGVTGNITSGNANLGNAATANFFIGSGNNLSNIQGANVTGAVSFATTANAVAGANVSGTVANATFATSAGTATTAGSATTAGTVTTAAQPNITSVGTLTSLNVSGTSNLGPVGNITITGGSNGYILQTDGSGNLSWTAPAVNNGIANGNSNVNIPVANGNVNISAAGNANVIVVTGTGANIAGTLNTTGLVTIPNTAGGATAIALGNPTQGNLISNAVTLANSSSVSNAIAQLNSVLGKLVPPSPPNFPSSQSIAISGLSTYRMANYVQTDNTPGANKSVSGGSTVSTVRRVATYSTNNITTTGPGDQGTISVQLNGSNAGGRTLTSALNGNGTYSNLTIFNNYDYNSANANIAAGFWSVFSANAAGTVTEGWNEVYIADSATSNTNTAVWFYDSSAPGTPAFSSLSISAPVSPSYVYSSTVPHYDNTNAFTVGFNVNRLSGNMYPTSDTFVTGTAGGSFGAPASVTYTSAGVTTPLARNLYVASGNATVSTTSTIISGFGASTTGPSVSVNNSYNTGTQAFTTTLAANVLYKTGTVSSATRIEEANVYIGSTIGSGSGLAFRIINPGSGNTPTFTGSEAAFNSQSSTLQTYDATVVANVLKHDQTNYSTGYLPTGPNLSSGRTSTQYFTFKFIRTSVSKFDVRWTGTIAGLWVALPGSTIDSTSTANGWVDMSVAYAGAGIPGANTGAGGNGSNGCALGGTAPLNSAQTNKSVTSTFGTVSSSSTATNEIYVRIALTSGQSVTALSLQTASN